MYDLPAGLQALNNYKQFILYRLVPKDNGKVDKVPSNASGYDIDPHKPSNWMTFEKASNEARNLGYGVGFSLTKDDPFFFVDIDGCAVEGGDWSPLAHDLCRQFAGAAVEVSQSGAGLHIIGRGMAPPHGKKNQALDLEFYTEARFIALTGKGVSGDASTDHTAALANFVPQFMPEKAGANLSEADWTSEAHEDWCGPLDDSELIAKMLGSGAKNTAFGGKASVYDLWTANVERLAISYPDMNGARGYDESSADAALASHLAFWTGNNCERIDRLMRQSALYREKWDSRDDYMPRTILGVTARCQTYYSNRSHKPANPEVDPSLSGFQFLTIDNQIDHFKDCIYVTDLHQVFTPWGDLLKADRFKSRFGGYEFALDKSNQKTTRNAFDAFTESQGHRFPKVDGEIFRPLEPTGKIIEEDGRSFVNTYMEVKTPRTIGDPTPFLNHLAAVLPDTNDQAILLAYMAACVQYKGIKFDWCPVLQGVEGNGKTLFTRCVRFGIGARYTHMPKASKIDSEFNGWLRRSIFVGVEDIYVPGHKQEVWETLKPMITGGDGIEIQFKGVDQTTDQICANFMLNCNRKDGLPKSRNDRRLCVLYTAQQSLDDLERAGMQEEGEYFSKLYDWLNDQGYSIVNEFLSTYQIPESLNPATKCRRAPITTSTDEAITQGLGGVEQEILEAIEEERPGFAGGWVSSLALERFLVQINAARKITPAKRWEMLETLGFRQHPALPRGRTNNATMTDNGRPRLFLKREHLALNLKTPGEVANAYDAAQTPQPQQTLAGRAFGNV